MTVLGRYHDRQKLYLQQAPQVLETLRRITIVESIEVSNRIDGIVVPPDRLKMLIAQAVPETRFESKVAGYRDALERVHTGQVGPPFTPDRFRALHDHLYAYLPGEGGMWRQRDCLDIVEGACPTPLPASEIPAAMDELCRHLAMAWESEQVDRLLVINAFIFDFLCIHPFPDGNGRLARLLVLHLLHAAGYEVGRYISLERFIEQTRETCCEALRRSGEHWDVGQHDLTPWYQYSLGVLVYAYRQFEKRVRELDTAPGAQGRAVQLTIGMFRPGRTFTIEELERACHGVKRATVRRVLGEMRAQGQVECLSTGRAARWRKL